jgi:hypothetical protein
MELTQKSSVDSMVWCTFMSSQFQQHYYVTKHLPSTLAVEDDIRNIGQVDFDFLKDAYQQPALENRYLEPENMSIVRGRDTESQAFMTPDNSEAE